MLLHGATFAPVVIVQLLGVKVVVLVMGFGELKVKFMVLNGKPVGPDPENVYIVSAWAAGTASANKDAAHKVNNECFIVPSPG
jgi:hypothetical protein